MTTIRLLDVQESLARSIPAEEEQMAVENQTSIPTPAYPKDISLTQNAQRCIIGSALIIGNPEILRRLKMERILSDITCVFYADYASQIHTSVESALNCLLLNVDS